MLFVLFWRCIVRSDRCSSRLLLSIKLHSPFTQFSPLSSSSSFPSPPPLNIISDLLTRECGFSSSQVTTVTRARPELLRTKSDHNAGEVIHLLKELGFTENKLKAAILRNPTLLIQRADRHLKPKLEYFKRMGLATQDIAHIIFYRPRFLNLSLENCLVPRILHLETLFGSKVHLCKVLRATPRLLENDFEKRVKPKVEYLKNIIGTLKDSTAFARVLHAVIELRLETLEAKIKHMASLGLTEEEIGQFLKVYPVILHMSTKKMTANIDFLIRTAGLKPKIVASTPMILSLSLEKRLKPRYEVFKSLRTNPHAKALPSLPKFFMLSERILLSRFGQYNTSVKSNDLTIS